jgi:hypothetical protein
LRARNDHDREEETITTERKGKPHWGGRSDHDREGVTTIEMKERLRRRGRSNHDREEGTSAREGRSSQCDEERATNRTWKEPPS